MIIVNTTFYVDSALESEFLTWLRSSYIPASPLSAPSLARILLDVGEEGMNAYALKLCAETMTEAQAWIEGEASLLFGTLGMKYGEKVLHFTTFMESIEL
ncbi:MAG: DUF4286 family protein [Muribaculaceae bacterium]|nr:DUF4286 family protein [Muribaculaceae bacterium]